MKIFVSFLRLAAIVSAVALLSLYVYDQAGGNLFGVRPVDSESSSDGLGRSVAPSSVGGPKLLPGSKSSLMFEVGSDDDPFADNGASATLNATPSDSPPAQGEPEPPTFLPSSKSVKVRLFNGEVGPYDDPFGGNDDSADPNATPPNAPPAQRESEPPTFLPGSKAPSMPLFNGKTSRFNGESP